MGTVQDWASGRVWHSWPAIKTEVNPLVDVLEPIDIHTKDRKRVNMRSRLLKE